MPRRTEIVLWYAACILLGIPWWMVVRFSLTLYALAYFWIWVALILATWRLGWGAHRIAGIVVAGVMNVAIWAALSVYLLGKLGDGPGFG